MRSIAASGVFGCARKFFDCLASLRPSERSDSVRVACEAVRDSGVERVQSWRVSHRARAEQCGSGELAIWANRVTWREAKPMGDQGRVSARLASCKCPLCEAGLIPCAGAKRPSLPSREAARRSTNHSATAAIFSLMPDPRAPDRSSNQQRWIGTEAFERGETSNARAGSERAAESDIRKPEMAARPSPVRG